MSYPQQGGYGPPQGGGYGQPQGGYGPPQGYGYPPPGPGGYGQYPPPRKNNTGLILGITGAVVAVVVALVLVLVLTGDDDEPSRANGDTGTSGDSNLPNGVPGPNAGGSGPGASRAGDSDSGGGSGGGSSSGGVSTAADLADIVVEVIETQDEDLIDEHACSSSAASQLRSELSLLAGMDVSATVEDVQESGDTAQASIDIDLGGTTESITAEMEKDGDAWCVSGI
ncbi:MAG: hypothetical protein M3422_07815 [Actinomycetota bacterium]|nr:hypothetical protein [Actinomycetota bacterium]